MIDWKKSEAKFLIGSRDEVSIRKRPRLVMICDKCGEVGTKTMRKSSDLDGDWLCRKCAMNTSKTKENISKAMIKHHKNNICSEETKAKMSANLKLMWENDEYKMSMKHRLSKRAKNQWADDSFRQFISENSKKLWKNEEYRDKITKVLSKSRSMMPKVTRIQEILYSLLDDINVKYYREYNDKEDDIGCKIGPYSFDCVIPLQNKTLLIECQGDYWHSLDDSKIKDKAKLSYIFNNFPDHEVKYLWEHEFLEKDRISELLKYWIGKNELEIIDFEMSDVNIKLCPPQEYRLLLSKYHYLSKAERGGTTYGAYLNEELIAVCSFSSLVRQNLPWDKNATRELSRLCIHPRYQKKNFASWFVSRCIKNLDPKYKTIISYCDTTFNHDGAVYKACNFKLDGEVRPDYWYVSEDGWVMHKKTLYNHASAMSMKEKDYAEHHGYKKVYGKKKLRFVFER